ncbi:MAG TPA: hypothetical protein VE503_06170 [Ornithinibacter sp.]|nr:hypothetical protein [Ornithinibacter sp.]
MTRFVWAAWGLLVVVLDLPLLGWDVLPDVVGYSWIVIGLAGAAEVHEAFVRARAAAAAGIPVALVSGTPLFNDQYGVEWGAAFAGILVSVTVMHQLATGIRDRAPEGDSDVRIYTRGIRIGAPLAGLVQLVGLVAIGTALAPLYFLGLLGLVVVGIVTVVLVHRVNRAGWLATTGAAPSGAAGSEREARPAEEARALSGGRGTLGSRSRSASSARSGIAVSGCRLHCSSVGRRRQRPWEAE